MTSREFIKNAQSAIRIIGELKELKIFGINCSVADQCFKIDNFFPVFGTVENDQDLSVPAIQDGGPV